MKHKHKAPEDWRTPRRFAIQDDSSCAKRPDMKRKHKAPEDWRTPRRFAIQDD